MLTDSDFLGRGFAFPLAFTPIDETGKRTLSWTQTGTDDIHESVLIILSTVPGERVLQPNFGCRLQELVFAEGNAATLALAERYVTIALEQWEPRIDVKDVAATYDTAEHNRISIALDYVVRATNSPDNLVFPFAVR